MSTIEETVRDHLNQLQSAEFPGKLGDVARILKIAIEDGQIGVVLEFDSRAEKTRVGQWRALAEESLLGLDDVSGASVVATRVKQAAQDTTQPPSPGPGTSPNTPPAPNATRLDGVKYCVAVASGKGGVGKSTTALNLAYALKATGLSVGLVDCDIFGPSIPHLLGCTRRPQAEDGKLQPIMVDDIATMSVGYLIDQDQAVVWRGPRVMGATRQMLRDVAWRDIDVLIIDLPPGTGDVQLTLVQQVDLAGALIVSTPQDLALIDARKAITMFEKTSTPILGIIENMSVFHCPACGHESAIFGSGGAEQVAATLSVPFLGALPLTLKIREYADAGTPLLRDAADSAEAGHYKRLAETLRQTIGL